MNNNQAPPAGGNRDYLDKGPSPLMDLLFKNAPLPPLSREVTRSDDEFTIALDAAQKKIPGKAGDRFRGPDAANKNRAMVSCRSSFGLTLLQNKASMSMDCGNVILSTAFCPSSGTDIFRSCASCRQIADLEMNLEREDYRFHQKAVREDDRVCVPKCPDNVFAVC